MNIYLYEVTLKKGQRFHILISQTAVNTLLIFKRRQKRMFKDSWVRIGSCIDCRLIYLSLYDLFGFTSTVRQLYSYP